MYDDISGNDYNDMMLGFSLIKAMKKAGKKTKSAFGFGGKKKVEKPSLLQAPTDGGTLQRISLGIGLITWAGGTAAGTVQRLEVRPQVPFAIKRITLIPTRSAGALGVGINVVDIQVAQSSIFAGGGQLPVELFAPNATDQVYNTKTCQVGQSILLDFVNTADVPAAPDFVQVSGGFTGDAVVQ